MAQKSIAFASRGVMLVLVILALTYQRGSAEEEMPQPPIALYFAIAHSGEISVTSGIMGLPNRMNPLPKSLPESIYNWLERQRQQAPVLVVRFEGNETVFNLKDHPVRMIQFDRGYYSADRLEQLENRLVLDAKRTFLRNDQPADTLVNVTPISILTGRRSCFESAFHGGGKTGGMYGVVALSVRLRGQPFVPENLDENWKGSLRQGEQVYVYYTYCNAGVWLRVERESGRIGWAKEWGLTEDLVERTFIKPFISPAPPPGPPPTITPFPWLTPPVTPPLP